MKNAYFFLLFLLLICLCGCGSHPELTDMQQVLYGFEHPQDSTRTKLWWFHGETETTRAGITADLEAFRKEGVGGVVYYDQVHGKCNGALEAFSPQWWEMLVFASQEAGRLGLTFEAHVSNGYVAGGPWITPKLGMQMLTSTDILVEGGKEVELALPEPDAPYRYFRDVAVLAFPFREGLWEDTDCLKPLVATNIPNQDAWAYFRKTKRLPVVPEQEPGQSAWIILDFGGDFTARSITYETRPRGKATTSATNVPASPSDTFVGTGYRVLPDLGQLEVSTDGKNYMAVCDLKPVYKAHSGWKQKTISFPAATGRYFRLRLHDWFEADERNKNLQIGNIVLSARASVDQWEEKAALYSEYIEEDRTPAYTEKEIVDSDRMIDLTGLTDSLGVLRWKAPAGKWVVMRFSHVPTGSKTKHGRKNLMGLECDKLSAEAAEVQWNHYFKVIADTIAANGGHLQGMAMDSHEAGSQNWTPGFEKEFERLRGYDLKKYLPVMAGYVVDSREVSDGFLYDVRRTIADLVSYNYYGTFRRLCKERNLTFTAQATGNALCLVADQIQAKGQVDKPQGEFWAIHPDGNYDIKESSSAAHLYGKSIASAEAFTDAKFGHSLAYIKQLADYAYCFGINEFVVCASGYQPWSDSIPGNTGGGRHYCLNRNNTLWPYSKGFWDYQARCAYVMRQGMPVADFCLYLGENAPVKILTHRLPEFPAGFDFDAFTTDALLSRMDAQESRIMLPDGMSYRMMILPRNGEMTLDALRKIASLVEAGIPVYGVRPVGSPTKHDADAKLEYKKLVESMWGKEDVPQGSHNYGRGTVYWGMPLLEAVTRAGLLPDVELPGYRKFYYAHRILADGELYFLDNHEDTPLEHSFTFRCSGKTIELWNPVSGERFKLQGTPTVDGRMKVALRMAPRESFFIIFSEKGSGDLPWKDWNSEEEAVPIQGEWMVDFAAGMGGPGRVVFPELVDWTIHKDERIKYYSGTAVYHQTFSVADNNTPDNGHFLLRFNKLGAVARVWLNGNEVGTVWCSPWDIDTTRFLKTGENELKIEVANSLMNRMIGDSMLPENERFTYSATPVATPKDTLVASGIIGPVWIVKRVGF